MKKVMKVVAALMLMTAAIFAAGCTKPDEPNNGGNDNDGNDNGIGTYNGHEYVDLGLPSGNLWATCNVGAETPEGYGHYFAWGETESKTTYNWSTYKHCNGAYYLLTKYCNLPNYGYQSYTDDLTVLEAIDDAATVNWGTGWRMPTQEECSELYENTTNTWTVQNGVNGRLFTASNGNSIFLPAAGWRHDDVLDSEGISGGYWLSSLGSGPYLAWYFGFTASTSDMGDEGYRPYAQCVRAIHPAQ